MKDSQTKQIFEYLYGTLNTLTGLQALKLFGCFRLPARIKDIEVTYGVRADRKKVKTKAGKYIEQYWFSSPKNLSV